LATELDEGTAVFPIHFDVPDHVLPLDTFVETAEQTAALIRALGDELADGKLVFQIVVVPPAEGSFKTRLGVIVMAGAVALWGFVESDIGKAFVKGISEHEPAHWSEQLGKAVRDSVSDALSASSEADDEALCASAAAILVELAADFLQADTEALQTSGVTVERYRAAYQARNEFYEACEQTPGLQGVGFSEEPFFPIQRADFVRLQVPLQPKDDDPEPWVAGLTILKVTSPNWNRDDKARQWKGRDPKGRDRFFRIDDEHFWLLVRQEKLNPHIIDTIKVQWAFQGTQDNPRNAKVLRVLRYNDEALAEPLDDRALDAILGSFSPVEEDQPDLFKED
jgi:hypothetical protein